MSLFDREFWAAQGALQDVSGGRGSISFITPAGIGANEHSQESVTGRWVLRHYRRGGLVARLLGDRYFWTSLQNTRCVREWRLLETLFKRGLPVPEPIAARYLRSGLWYRADLITAELPPSQTLAVAIARGPLSQQQWTRIGSTIAVFHAEGVHHADLNAHNILLGEAGVVYLLDFDRGRIRTRGNWEGDVVQRLRRSLEKISSQQSSTNFSDVQWRWLLAGLSESANNSSGSRPTSP